MSAEIVDTSRLFARTVAKIQAEWVEHAAKHLLKYHYSEPRWEQRPAMVAADEKSALYGMVVTPKKRVNFGPIDPVVSRQQKRALPRSFNHRRHGAHSWL